MNNLPDTMNNLTISRLKQAFSLLGVEKVTTINNMLVIHPYGHTVCVYVKTDSLDFQLFHYGVTKRYSRYEGRDLYDVIEDMKQILENYG